jgi:hypothetical protein
MKQKIIKIPGDLVREFKGDIRIMVPDDGQTTGIWLPPHEMLMNPDLVKKLSENFEPIFIPKESLEENE